MILLNAPSGANLEDYFAQMPTGESVALRLERGGTYPGDIRYEQGGGGSTLATHYIMAMPGPGPLPVIEGAFQVGIEAQPITGLVVRDLEMSAEGINVLSSGAHLRLENLVATAPRQGLRVQAEGGLRWEDVIVQRCRVLDLDTQDAGATHGNGMYFFGIDGLAILDNVIDRAVGPLDIFSHHIYVQNGNTNVRIRRNLLTRASSHAIQCRPGGIVHRNLMLDNPIGLLMGGGTDPESGGVHINVSKNVVLGGGNIDPLSQFPDGQNAPRGWAYYLENVAGGNLSNNVAADAAGGDPKGLIEDCSADAGFGAQVGVLDVHGTNYHRAHGNVQIVDGNNAGTTTTLVEAPNQDADLDYEALGLDWNSIRAGTVDVLAAIAAIRTALGLRV